MHIWLSEMFIVLCANAQTRCKRYFILCIHQKELQVIHCGARHLKVVQKMYSSIAGERLEQHTSHVYVAYLSQQIPQHVLTRPLRTELDYSRHFLCIGNDGLTSDLER